MTASAPATNRLRSWRPPFLLMLPSLSLPPLECCFGTSPIQAEKLRPESEDPWIRDTRNQSGRQHRTDPGDVAKALARILGSVPSHNHPIELQNLLLEAE